MNVLIIGSGGREHAFAWKLSQSRKLENLFIAPGNAGTSQCGTNIDIPVNDFQAIKNLVWEKNIDMVLVGPEEPLVRGIHDFFLSDEVLKDVPVIGPRRDGAQLEGSKDFSKQFMLRNNIPTAKYKSFTSETIADAVNFLKTLSPPFVLKADGLAAGKGVVISDKLDEAVRELNDMLLNSKFGSASSTVVIEEFLNGVELSVFVLTDGKSYKVLPAAKDYKRIGEGDKGLNTGGMGAISPVPFADEIFLRKVEEKIVKPTIEGLKRENIDYRGFVFIGLMNCQGEPYVIEYNCRMGDPETEVVIPRIKSDLLDLLEGVATQNLEALEFETVSETAATVVMVSGGYPEEFEKGKIITHIPASGQETVIFHSGTKTIDGNVVTNGGRVLAITSFGNSITEAVEKSLRNADKIQYEKKYFRRDIGKDLLQ